MQATGQQVEVSDAGSETRGLTWVLVPPADLIVGLLQDIAERSGSRDRAGTVQVQQHPLGIRGKPA